MAELTYTHSQSLGEKLALLARQKESADSFVQSRAAATLAALRTGAGKAPGEAPRMLPFMAEFLRSVDPEDRSVIAMFTVASLLPKNPKQVNGRSLGMALWHATKRDENKDGKHLEEGVSKRFVAALDSDPEDLPRHLETLVTLCASADEGLDWRRFTVDVAHLIVGKDDDRDAVRMRWARDFWQGPRRTTNEENEGVDE